ncbi:TPA: hypothetical protein U2K22_003204 [Legionella pneumophila]|nr:hypothetical protein [Legionella pneumophila]HEM6992149.1 hypothetical protein [Legionella pneumophila]HEM7052065.1 hypothetical protein [Legionella pneumophila]HEM7061605.1 hypothetical protein [Legionella pneumophila]HEM7077637.1 hypothetical protein [Legionella pneumophila]
MNKDNEKHQPVPESTTTAESKIPSATLISQLLNKEKIKEAGKKESASEDAKVRCKVCFKEIAPKRLCSGHGGGGGGGGDSASSDKISEERPSQKVIETTDELIDEFALMEDSEAIDEKSFDTEVIAELIAKGLLLVDSDREAKTLTIKLLCDPNVLTEEQREELKKFMEAITKEYNEFKEENSLSDDCIKITHDENGNMSSLRITMPTLALYDVFIQRLANNLAPIPSHKAQERKDVTKDQGLDPNPLSMEPKPYNKDKLSKREEMEPNKDIEPKKAEEEEQKIFSPSPFNMKPW